MSTDIASRYEEFYRRRNPEYVYPVEFVVRAYLGAYPRLPRVVVAPGARALDLGCGDGRNMPLLFNLGMAVYGTDISGEICTGTMERMQRLGVRAETRVGRNCSIPFGAHRDELHLSRWHRSRRWPHRSDARSVRRAQWRRAQEV
jgi:SAM-dependent methyltransferase